MKKGCLFAALAATLLLTGCGNAASVYANYRELENLQLVQTLGYDTRGELTVISASSGRGTEKLPPVVISGEGNSITEAIHQLQAWSAKEDIFFAHTQYVVIGEEAARGGLEPLLDWFERSTQTRLNLPVFLVEGGTAKDLVTDSEDDAYEITAALTSLRRNSERRGDCVCFTLADLAERLARSGCALCASVRPASTEENVASAEKGALTALETGFAVLRDGKLLCYTGRDAARGICLLLKEAGRGSLLLPDGTGGKVLVELNGGTACFHPRWDEAGRPSLRVYLTYRAGIVEADTFLDHGDDALGRLNREFTAWLTARARDALELSVRTGTDFLELGRAFQRDNPEKYAALDWEDALSALEYTVESDGEVERSYDMDSPSNITGEGRDRA